MLRLIRSGLIAAIRQTCATVPVTLIVAFLTSPSDPLRFVSEPKRFADSAAPLLAWAYLIVAVGCALTIDKSTHIAVDSFRRASNGLHSSRPESILIAVVAQSVICAAALALLELRGPPDLLNRAIDRVGAWPISIIWPSTLSVGVAFFGATAFAASRAIADKGL